MCKEILFGVQDRIGEKCMNEKELRYMKCIAEAGSIQKAAVLLRKNPSSLSRAVHRVEEDMDIILFKRTPEGCGRRRRENCTYRRRERFFPCMMS